jgi:hypothetical protein
MALFLYNAKPPLQSANHDAMMRGTGQTGHLSSAAICG